MENGFKEAVKSYLDERAKNDSQFAERYALEGKSLTDCCNYIMRQAQKRGRAVVMSEEEVYGLAVHYYDEDIPAKECRPVGGGGAATGKGPRQSRGMVDRADVAIDAAELTEEEKARAKELAMAKYRDELVAELRAEERARREEKKRKDKERREEKKRKDKERREAFAAKQLSLFEL